MKENDTDFVARHYREGRFSVNAGWRRLGIGPAAGWRRYRVAAAIAATVILSATAAVMYRSYRIDREQPTVETAAPNVLTTVRVIDFENASLAEVVRKIEAVYGVEVENIPASPEKYVLSLHYEGTPTDLIETVNDILDTDMTVTEE